MLAVIPFLSRWDIDRNHRGTGLVRHEDDAGFKGFDIIATLQMDMAFRENENQLLLIQPFYDLMEGCKGEIIFIDLDAMHHSKH